MRSNTRKAVIPKIWVKIQNKEFNRKNILTDSNFLHKNQFLSHNLRCAVSDVIHHSDPTHLIFRFELFGDAFLGRHFFYDPKEHILCLHMELKGIKVSTGSACDGQNTAISHVLRAIQLDEIYARGTIRISLGDYNCEDDVIAIVKVLSDIIC